jgi:N-acetyl-anhydromuramyl-L-alanine amidase AmpD
MNIIQDQSPNYTKGRAGKIVDTLVLHSTYGSYWGSVNHLKNVSSKVSAHYIISEHGEIRRLVGEMDTAWANGNLDSNQRSITIETTDNRLKEITQKAKDALIWLVSDIRKRHNIRDIKFHREIVATACPFLDIRKEWFTQVDPLKECLRLHGELVKENTILKAKVAELQATEKRLISEKDTAIQQAEQRLATELAKVRSECEIKIQDRINNFKQKISIDIQSLIAKSSYGSN